MPQTKTSYFENCPFFSYLLKLNKQKNIFFQEIFNMGYFLLSKVLCIKKLCEQMGYFLHRFF